MKILLLTHTDLDGFGSRILAEHHFINAGHELTTVHLDNNKVDEWVTNMLTPDENGHIRLAAYDKVVMTDISVNESTAEMIDDALNGGGLNYFVLLDHHKTALFLNKYSWAIVKIEHEKGKLASGTSLFLQYLKTDWDMLKDTRSEVVAEIIRKYDTWEWHDVYHDEFPKLLNDLFYLYGPERFVEHMNWYMGRKMSDIFTQDVMVLLAVEADRIEDYYRKKKRNIHFSKFEKYNTATVFADSYHSQLGMMISRDYPEVDIVSIVSFGEGKMSFRTTKPGVDVSEIALRKGGGGHPKASGSPIPKELIQYVTQALWDN